MQRATRSTENSFGLFAIDRSHTCFAELCLLCAMRADEREDKQAVEEADERADEKDEQLPHPVEKM